MPLPSSKNPRFQNEARCTTFLLKMTFICTRMKNDFRFETEARGNSEMAYLQTLGKFRDFKELYQSINLYSLKVKRHILSYLSS